MMNRNLFIILALVTFITSCNSLEKKFKNEGIKTSGRVFSKDKNKKVVDGEKVATYTLKIAFTTPDQSVADTASLDNLFSQIIDNPLEYIQTLKNSFTTAEADVPVEIFNKYAIGSKVSLYYLPEDPEFIMLADQVDAQD